MLTDILDNEANGHEGTRALGKLDREGTTSLHSETLIEKNADGTVNVGHDGADSHFGSASTGVQSLGIEPYIGPIPCKIEVADTIKMRGRIDVDNSGEMRDALAKALHRRPTVLHVNLADVYFIASSGLATLVEAAGIARKQGIRMILEGLRDQPRYLLEVTHLDHLFDIPDPGDHA